MLETPHVVVAAAIATKISNPLLSLPLAFGSHFLLERVPHWNPHLNTEKKTYGKVTKNTFKIVLADASLALVLGSFIAYQALPDINKAIVVFLACFLGALPDLIEAPYYFLNHKSHFIEKAYIPFKKSIQADAQPLWGLLTQLIIILVAFWWIFQ